MLLALDIGNTNVTAGVFRAGALLATRRATTNARGTTDELEVLPADEREGRDSAWRVVYLEYLCR